MRVPELDASAEAKRFEKRGSSRESSVFGQCLERRVRALKSGSKERRASARSERLERQERARGRASSAF